MPKKGDHFIVELGPSHVDWGRYRRTDTRELIDGEGYIPIPSHEARRLGIYNSNHSDTGLGFNLFNCTSADNLFVGVLKATGCSEAGNIYAKQFHGNGDLKALGRWFRLCSANVGDRVEIRWISPIDVIIELL